MIGEEHHHLYERLERRIDEIERDLRELRDGDVRRMVEFRKMVQVALFTVFATITYVSAEGWELLRRIFIRQ